MKEEEEAVGGVPLEVALWEGVALGEGEGEEVGTSPVAEESLIHGEWGSVLACVNIYVILTAISKKQKVISVLSGKTKKKKAISYTNNILTNT